MSIYGRRQGGTPWGLVLLFLLALSLTAGVMVYRDGVAAAKVVDTSTATSTSTTSTTSTQR
ncbi:hypothetical protein [Actinopolymorpha rutila]|uniref:F0F1-type ATP synthase assembly protein I n=1 Tax=Actinopolymorpha rutila TaxID=446787 RepID=A0A852ZHT7_9ACTN|nr:hypothetical protein [Actinopolymorpha rutila]NYH91478.1 F0F1-type ATP synthase assembly protein I [Actinopolymorpha rutila]